MQEINYNDWKKKVEEDIKFENENSFETDEEIEKEAREKQRIANLPRKERMIQEKNKQGIEFSSDELGFEVDTSIHDVTVNGEKVKSMTFRWGKLLDGDSLLVEEGEEKHLLIQYNLFDGGCWVYGAPIKKKLM